MQGYPGFLAFFVIALVTGTRLQAQMGDSRDTAGIVQRPPPAEWVRPAPVLSPQEALKTFSMPPGFRIELVASEPMIHEPIALDFDADGRLWVVEMRSYMPDADGKGEDQPINRVVVLEDTDKDGRMDKSTVYMEGLRLARAIKVLEHGVLIGEPPNLWFTRDTNGDGKMDEKTAIATDFSLADGNPEEGANGLIWGLDNWIGGSSYGRRLRLQDGKWISSPVALRGQWGQGMDDYGRKFTNSNEDYFRADLIPNQYPARNPNMILSARRDPLGTGVNFLVDPNETVWPIVPTPGVNRGYWDNILRPDGRLLNVTAACGPMIYRGDNFPAEFHGNYFCAEPTAHVVRRSLITEENGILKGRNAYEKGEFLASTDERFRPVNVYTAPDGTIYVVDLYRGILQHRQYMTSYLRKQVIERKLDQGLGYGRIYRIVHEGKKPGPAPVLSKATTAQLVATLTHPNGWWRDTAQRLLVERGDKTATAEVKKLALTSGASVPTRLQALWTLEGLSALDAETIGKIMADPAPKLRAVAIRLTEPELRENSGSALARVTKQIEDPSPEVRLQLALSAGEAKTAAAEIMLAQLLAKDPTAPLLVPAVISGLAGRELAFMGRLGLAPEWREGRPGFAKVFEALAGAVAQEGRTEGLNELFHFARDERRPKWQRTAVLDGVNYSGIRKIAAPLSELDLAAKSADEDIARPATELQARFIWPGKFGSAPVPLTEAEQELFEQGKVTYTTICMACHQPDGRGQPGLAAPLVNSRWVLGSDRTLARIVLKGKTGQNPAAMPPLEMLGNQALAGALTYIRRSWGHEAPPVSAATVGAMRQDIIIRTQPYTDAELDKLKE